MDEACIIKKKRQNTKHASGVRHQIKGLGRMLLFADKIPAGVGKGGNYEEDGGGSGHRKNGFRCQVE